MSEDEVMELAQRAGTYTEVEDGEEWLVMSESSFPVFAALIAQHLYYDGIHTCHDECPRPACVAVREAVKAEREACAQIAFNAKTYIEAAAAIRARGEK